MKKILAILVLLFLWNLRPSRTELEFAHLSTFRSDSLVSRDEGSYKILRSSKYFEIDGTRLVDFDYIITTSKEESRFYRNDTLVVFQGRTKLIVYEGEYEYQFNK